MSQQSRAVLSRPITVFVTIRCWPDQPGQELIAEAVENALWPILSQDESLTIDVVDRRDA